MEKVLIENRSVSASPAVIAGALVDGTPNKSYTIVAGAINNIH